MNILRESMCLNLSKIFPQPVEVQLHTEEGRYLYGTYLYGISTQHVLGGIFHPIH